LSVSNTAPAPRRLPCLSISTAEKGLETSLPVNDTPTPAAKPRLVVSAFASSVAADVGEISHTDIPVCVVGGEFLPKRHRRKCLCHPKLALRLRSLGVGRLLLRPPSMTTGKCAPFADC
jgi:hypothetical protein